MSKEGLIGIGVSIILFIAGLFFNTSKRNVSVKQKSKNGTQNMNNNTIGNEININENTRSKK